MALVGYARVSTQDQNPDLQRDALAAAGCARVFEDAASGARAERPGLAQALDYVRDGDVLVVWKLDRLGQGDYPTRCWPRSGVFARISLRRP